MSVNNYIEYSNKGLSGLTNLGNTCFINSCMQILSHTYELNIFLNKETYKQKLKKIPDTIVLLEWDNLRKLLWSENCVISPNKFIKLIQYIASVKDREIFTGYSQNDVTEFLLFIIDCFHSSISREINMTISGNVENDTDEIAVKCFEMIKNMYSKDYSEIWNIFYAVNITEIKTIETNKRLSLIPEPYFIIDLPIPPEKKSHNLYDCFDYYSVGEILEDENSWYNEETKQKERVKKTTMFWSFPNVLVIAFKRFNSNNMKKQVLIDFPINDLDLSKYVVGYKKNNYVYDLFGVCNHSGNVHGGHYTAYIKNANTKWYHFNDTNVTELEDSTKVITPKAYCLFYRKKVSS